MYEEQGAVTFGSSQCIQGAKALNTVLVTSPQAVCKASLCEVRAQLPIIMQTGTLGQRAVSHKRQSPTPKRRLRKRQMSI